MRRQLCEPRLDWQARAQEFGFHFHTMYGQPYWDESAYYQFSLQQIERDLEAPTAELHQMCLEVVDRVVGDEALLQRFQIPAIRWDWIAASWRAREPSLYSRLDLAYTGEGPAKLLENNADTPTSLYETGFWQWLWLEDTIAAGRLPQWADQFNSLQEQLIQRFQQLRSVYGVEHLHCACCQDTPEDRGTVQYLQDCAEQAGLSTEFVPIEEVGKGEGGVFTDLDDQVISAMFKLYPWEFMLREEYAPVLLSSQVRWLEPAWKALLSNKALLPLLWRLFPNHPNLLAAYFADELASSGLTDYVKKPIFAREGANISIVESGEVTLSTSGPYGDEGFIYQAYCPLPQFAGYHTLVGSWLVDDQPAGISIREDSSRVTQDLSRYLPHIILD